MKKTKKTKTFDLDVVTTVPKNVQNAFMKRLKDVEQKARNLGYTNKRSINTFANGWATGFAHAVFELGLVEIEVKSDRSRTRSR